MRGPRTSEVDSDVGADPRVALPAQSKGGVHERSRPAMPAEEVSSSPGSLSEAHEYRLAGFTSNAIKVALGLWEGSMGELRVPDGAECRDPATLQTVNDLPGDLVV